ncbi:sulfatase-like hydrolase/transferase [Haloquadratum walsbyi]|jgi:Arylsulfatase A and related enzymes|uniref:Arylsulfatase A related enzyme n=1 Tax=Haloquadratum walsbyi J07HQW2 TaxID=1238425 RepID=U1PRD7_9EURY|nr:sulfatase-like hydrolase/transferase [Haloquadratum walsbyi]ERG94881.1 MAG: arylsulfatase A related enzyme [Haloquadratum walsbyi J07HQW2]
MNVALVVLDTLRLDAFREEFGWLPGHRFEQAWSPANWTVPVHGSLFTGHSPGEIGVHAKHQSLDCPEPTLAKLLSKVGYRTQAFSANPNISPIFGFDRGFKEFYGSYRLNYMEREVYDWQEFISEHQSQGLARYVAALREILSSDIATLPSLRRGLDIKLRDLGVRSDPDDDGAKRALSLIKSTQFDDDEFLFCNLMETHAPYDPPREYWTTEWDDDRSWTTFAALLATITGHPPEGATPERLKQAYDDSVRYLSDIYENIFEELRDSFDVVITLSDHGELFDHHSLYQHAYGLYPELTHVPLVISGNEIHNGNTSTPVSLTDVFHTIAELTGVQAGDSNRALISEGSVSEPEDRSIYTEYHGVSHQNRQRIINAGYSPDPYDEKLFGVVDAGGYGYQTMEGFNSPAKGTTDLLNLVKSYAESLDNREYGSDNKLPASVKRQLEDLGYA